MLQTFRIVAQDANAKPKQPQQVQAAASKDAPNAAPGSRRTTQLDKITGGINPDYSCWGTTAKAGVRL